MMKQRVVLVGIVSCVVLAGGVASAGQVVLDTGQAKCFNNNLEITCPEQGQPFRGQDAQYQNVQPSYRIEPGGLTVTELNTGLEWQRGESSVVLDLQRATDYCAALELDGHDDWRLPSLLELQSIVDHSRTIPPLFDTTVFLLELLEDPLYFYYMSSTFNYVLEYRNPWTIDMADGRTYYPGTRERCRCVRAGF